MGKRENSLLFSSRLCVSFFLSPTHTLLLLHRFLLAWQPFVVVGEEEEEESKCVCLSLPPVRRRFLSLPPLSVANILTDVMSRWLPDCRHGQDETIFLAAATAV